MSKLPWDGPLFPVKGHLAERYDEALRHVAKLECPLREFGVDRMGWSPQLAAILGENYLGGDALRYAIILSPDQAEAPPVRRRFSYEAALIEDVYLEARATLLSLVEREPVLVELDPGVAFCRTAGDVLGIQAVSAHVDTPRATLAQSRRLLELGQGLATQVRLLDEAYIDQMLALAAQVGDPRKRVAAPEIRQPLGSVWAEVGGTTYLLRQQPGTNASALLIATRPTPVPPGSGIVALELDEPQVIGVLQQYGFVRYDNLERLLPKRLAELETEALLAVGEESPAGDPLARRRQLAANPSVRSHLRSLYWELDAANKQLASGGQLNVAKLSVEARWALATPARDAEVVGHLIARFVRYDHRMFGLHHRRIVDAEWQRYSPTKRRYLEATFPYMTQGFVRGTAASAAS